MFIQILSLGLKIIKGTYSNLPNNNNVSFDDIDKGLIKNSSDSLDCYPVEKTCKRLKERFPFPLLIPLKKRDLNNKKHEDNLHVWGNTNQEDEKAIHTNDNHKINCKENYSSNLTPINEQINTCSKKVKKNHFVDMCELEFDDEPVVYVNKEKLNKNKYNIESENTSYKNNYITIQDESYKNFMSGISKKKLVVSSFAKDQNQDSKKIKSGKFLVNRENENPKNQINIMKSHHYNNEESSYQIISKRDIFAYDEQPKSFLGSYKVRTKKMKEIYDEQKDEDECFKLSKPNTNLFRNEASQKKARFFPRIFNLFKKNIENKAPPKNMSKRKGKKGIEKNRNKVLNKSTDNTFESNITPGCLAIFRKRGIKNYRVKNHIAPLKNNILNESEYKLNLSQNFKENVETKKITEDADSSIIKKTLSKIGDVVMNNQFYSIERFNDSSSKSSIISYDELPKMVLIKDDSTVDVGFSVYDCPNLLKYLGPDIFAKYDITEPENAEHKKYELELIKFHLDVLEKECMFENSKNLYLEGKVFANNYTNRYKELCRLKVKEDLAMFLNNLKQNNKKTPNVNN